MTTAITDTTCFVLLHGLTFDHRMWDPVIDELPAGRRALALDLPGHSGMPLPRRRGLAPVADAVHDAVLDAGLDRPVVVGHSIGGPIAAIYAATFPAAGVVSVDAPLRFEQFAEALVRLRPLLAGDAFGETWCTFQESWRMDLVPSGRRELLRAGEHGSQEVVLSYQADLLERPLDDVVRWRDEGLSRLARAGTPYVSVHAGSVDPGDAAWLRGVLPQAEIVVWPVDHHFPHLADPRRFAGLLERVAGLGASRAGSARRG